MTDTIETLKQQLDELTDNPNISDDERLMTILRMGTQMFKLPIGIISHIESKVYRVDYTYGTDGINIGDVFNLGDTYCSITRKRNRLLAIDYMNISDYFRHPCYKLFSLSSYFGMPIWVNGKQYGTLNFSGPDEREPAFTETEKTMLQMLADFVSTVLSRKEDQHTVS